MLDVQCSTIFFFFLVALFTTGAWSSVLLDDSVTVEAYHQDDEQLFSLGSALLRGIAKTPAAAAAAAAVNNQNNNATFNTSARQQQQITATTIAQVDQMMFQPFCNRELFAKAIGVCDSIFPPLPCPCPKCPDCAALVPPCPKCPDCSLVPTAPTYTTNTFCVSSGATSASGKLVYNSATSQQLPSTLSICNFALFSKDVVANQVKTITFTCKTITGNVGTTGPYLRVRKSVTDAASSTVSSPIAVNTPVTFDTTGAYIFTDVRDRLASLECDWTSV